MHQWRGAPNWLNINVFWTIVCDVFKMTLLEIRRNAFSFVVVYFGGTRIAIAATTHVAFCFKSRRQPKTT